jgi:hypothetical protein
VRRAIAVLIVAGVAALAASPPVAFAAGAGERTPYPDRFCRSVHVRHQPWGVDGSGPRCHFMRKWTKRFLHERRKPDGWRCGFLGEMGDCHHRGERARFFEFYLED